MSPSKADSLMFAIHSLELRIERDEENHAKTVAFYQERDPEQVGKLVAARERRLSLFHAHLANLNDVFAAQVKVEA
jgi:O-acetylhomoserine/O-acetylserine sulfhydrylase-like pyridoxal-dependent enzyme